MRISDWSSDVCSSDLLTEHVQGTQCQILTGEKQALGHLHMQRRWRDRVLVEQAGNVVDEGRIAQLPHRNIDSDDECRMLHAPAPALRPRRDRKSTRLNSNH